MSKRRLVILSVTLEGRTQADTARLYDVSEATVSRWVARYRSDGEAAFEPRSRRPKTSPSKIPHVVIDQIVNLRDELVGQGLDRSADTSSPQAASPPSRANDRSRRLSASPPIYPTKCGKRI